MSVIALERRVWQEAKKVFNNPKLRLKDLQEWSTSEEAIRYRLEDGEVMAAMPQTGAWVAIPKEHDKRS